MIIRNCSVLACLALLAVPAIATADNSVLSGIFDGSENRIAPLPGTCQGAPDLGYQTVSNVQVGATGLYIVADVYNFSGADLTVLLYNGNFNPGNPQNNLLTPNGIDIADAVNLSSGTNYTMVVQHWCQNREGAWAVTFSGPGSVNSTAVVTTPDFTEGTIAQNDPTANSDCGDSQYQEFGPIQVSRSGTYYYTDISINYEVDMCLQIYSAPFNPNATNANRVGSPMDDFGTIELQAGQNYYFVVQPLQRPQVGEFFYVFSPPAPFAITHAMAGGWFDLETAGQGLLIDVFDQTNELFTAWFTYDLQRPDPAVTAMIGDPGHRWMTAQGPFTGDTAELDITWTTGMIFDSADPTFEQTQDGAMTIEFSDCLNGMVSYDLGSANVTGQFPIVRLANQVEDLCLSLIQGPGQPGPL
jgi:hypothetical protein